MVWVADALCAHHCLHDLAHRVHGRQRGVASRHVIVGHEHEWVLVQMDVALMQGVDDSGEHAFIELCGNCVSTDAEGVD